VDCLRAAPGRLTMDPRPQVLAPFRRFAVLALALVALAGCSTTEDPLAGGTSSTTVAPGVASGPIPAEDASTPTIPVPADFVVPDTRSVRLLPVVGKDQPDDASDGNTLPVDGGRSTIQVRVVDEGGRAVGGASVRVERFVGSQRGWVTVRTGGNGTATITDALGGRYRVRGWLAPDLASVESQLTFVGEGETKTVEVQVRPHDAPVLQGALNVPQWSVGETAAFEVLLLQEDVDSEGIVRGAPITALVTLTPLAGPRVDSPNPVPTDPVSGRAVFALVCLVPGTHQVVLSGYGRSFPVILPECLPSNNPIPPEPGEGPIVATPRPTPGAPTTTSTTVLKPIAFPVGSTFSVPFPGVLPAGTYVATDDVDPKTCRTTFEQSRNGVWTAQRSNGATLILSRPSRNFAAAVGSVPCSYERTR